MSRTFALQVNNLRVSYMTGEHEVKAVDDVSFSLYPGERLGVVGESGSGKTTLALALMRLHKPPAYIMGGEALLDGSDILALEREAMRQTRWSKLSLIPQGSMNSLNPVVKIKHQMADAIEAHERGWTSARKHLSDSSMRRAVSRSASIESKLSAINAATVEPTPSMPSDCST
jgi:peptide/nickel transport system ATP-binding protein